MTATPERHLPVDLDVLATGLAELLPPEEREDLDRLARLAFAHQAVEVQAEVDALARRYRPFDQSRETRQAPDEDGSEPARGAFLAALAELAERANYEEVPRAALDRALAETSPRGLQVRVDLDELRALRVWRRGRAARSDTYRASGTLWTKQRTVETELFPRLLIAVGTEDDPDHLHLRLFKDVARSDLEMFLPNTDVRMTVVDKVKLAVTGGGGTVGGLAATLTKLGAAASPLTWAMGLAGIGGLVWRQVAKVFAQRTRYAAALANYLYFHGLDNDLGAVHHLAQQAATQESAEALLAYAVLASAEEGALTREELDARAEAHLAARHGVTCDFEVDDGLRKLREVGILEEGEVEDARLAVPRPAEAFARLDAVWDARFGS